MDVKNKKILLVEDNLLNQQLTASILSRAGYTTDIAENGRVGVELFKKNHYEVVLMDIQMPVMDGIEATKMIREYEQTNGGTRAKIIAVTAHAQEEEKVVLFDAGMDHYLCKPFKTEELIGMITTNGNSSPF